MSGRPPEIEKGSDLWVPLPKRREPSRRRALSSTRSRDRSAAGADWTEGLVDVRSAPGTFTVLGSVRAMVIRRIGPHGFCFDVASNEAPVLGEELHVAIPGAPARAGLITVVGQVANRRAAPEGARQSIEVSLSEFGGVPAAYWDLVTYWAEHG